MSPFGDYGQGLKELVDIARHAYEAAGRHGRLQVVAHYDLEDSIMDKRWAAGSQTYEDLAALGVDRLVVPAPADGGEVERAAAHLPLGCG